jgi:glutamate 5-kinase
MTALSELLKKSRKIVIKIGSNVLSSDNGTVNREVMRDIADQVNSLMNSGKQVIIVSSGAGICGRTE